MEADKKIGPADLAVVIADGKVALKASVSQAVGGGDAAGVVTAKASLEIDLSAEQALDLADAMLKAHFPSLGGVIDTAIGAAKAQLSHL